MSEFSERLEHRLRVVVGLSDRMATHVASEMLDMFDETVDEFIVTRHGELQREGLRTDAIYRRIRSELSQWRFRSVDLSIRQIRRRIYG
jgi:hypothetical protein